MSKSIEDKIKEMPSIYEESLYSGRNKSIKSNWRSGLHATHMSEFITSNGYEWGFIFFRALLENKNYRIQVKDGIDETGVTEQEISVVMHHWGDVSKEYYDYDWADLAGLFEIWCKNNKDKLVFDQIAGIDFIDDSQNEFVDNTLYLKTSKQGVIKDEYQRQLEVAIKKINKQIAKRKPFDELAKKGSTEQLHNYERWLDVAHAANLNDAGYDKYHTLLDIIHSGKDCWKGLTNKYNSVEPEFANRELPESTDTKDFFDIIAKAKEQGEFLISNVQKGLIKGGR